MTNHQNDRGGGGDGSIAEDVREPLLADELSAEGIPSKSLRRTVDEYTHIFGKHDPGKQAQKLALLYYNLVTRFYEIGWGQCFHFAPRHHGESFKASLKRFEHYLADRLSLQPGMQVLDVGCGIGGPMRNLARYSGAHFTGVNINAGQLERAQELTARHELQSLCSFLLCDFMQLSSTTDTCYDVAMSIDAMPYAPDRVAAFREVFSVLRPGALFGVYDWCLTERFDETNQVHRQIREGIMKGVGVLSLSTQGEVCSALRQAGFELQEEQDIAVSTDSAIPWYAALQNPGLSLTGLSRTPAGRAIINWLLRLGEGLRLVPKGTHAVHSILNVGADALVQGGETGVFTPMYFYLARKPLDA